MEWARAHFLFFRGVAVATELDPAGGRGRIAESYGLEIFDLQFRREATGWVLRVVLDRRARTRRVAAGPGAGPESSIEDCQHVSHDLSAMLDVDEELAGR